MSKSVLTDLAFSGGAKISGLPAAAASGEAVTYEQLNSVVEGLSWKDDVVAASTANINLSAPGTTIDGVTMVSGDRFLAKDQTTASANGIYIWNGSGTTATRATDMSVSAEFNAAVTTVKDGTTHAGTSWRQTAVDPTVGTTSIVFTSFGAAGGAASETSAGIAELATQGETDTGTDDLRIVTPLKLATSVYAKKKYATDVGDGAATSYTVTHNLATRDVIVMVRRNSGNYDEVLCDVNVLTTNTVQLIFATAPTSALFRCIVIG